MALGAAPAEQDAGMRFQAEVLEFLRRDSSVNSQWLETRGLLLRDIFHSRREDELSKRELDELNYLESIRGDLTDIYQGVSMECQTAVSSPDPSWEHSKFERSRAGWQCFGFLNGHRLVVRTSAIKEYIVENGVQPQNSKRARGRPYYSLGEDFLRSIGAVDLSVWRDEYRSSMKPLSLDDNSL